MSIVNITLSSDEETVRKTREYARRRGTSLNELLRAYMRSLTEQEDPDEVADEFARNAIEQGGRSENNYRFDREEANRR